MCLVSFGGWQGLCEIPKGGNFGDDLAFLEERWTQGGEAIDLFILFGWDTGWESSCWAFQGVEPGIKISQQ